MKCPPPIMVQLIHIHGGLKGQIQEYPDALITIGRLPSFTLPFPADEPGVSREHAKIEREGNQFKLVTLKDKFGTFVNGKQVKEAVLRNGDVIEFGSGGPKVSFNAEIGESVAEPEPPFQPQHPAQVQVPVQRNSAPLVIQYGPTIRTYRELPVVIGAHAQCDFVLSEGGIQDQHAQIFTHQGNYFVKDLTVQRLLRVNGRPIQAPVQLKQFDEIGCGPQGPVFRFLGEGRLAEVEVAQSGELSGSGKQDDTDPETGKHSMRKSTPSTFLSKIVKGFW